MHDTQADPLAALAGESPAMRAVRAQLAYAVTCGDPVMLVGEAGTGKHLAASLLAGGRCRAEVGPSQLTSDSLLAWLAPPAAPEVLLIRDPHHLTPETQQRLMRVLADPASAGLPTRRLPRLITLARSDPLTPSDGPPLRADLYHYLAAVTVRLPPLRHRPGDIELLLRRRLGVALAVDRGAARRLAAHTWPGNVGELLALAGDLATRLGQAEGVLTEAMLPPELGATALLGTAVPMQAQSVPEPSRPLVRTRWAETEVVADGRSLPATTLTPFSQAIIPLAVLERRAVEHALGVCGGDVALAARRLGLSESALRQRLRQWKLEPD